MKTKIAFVALIVVASFYTLQAQSDEQAAQDAKPVFNAPPIMQDLLGPPPADRNRSLDK